MGHFIANCKSVKLYIHLHINPKALIALSALCLSTTKVMVIANTSKKNLRGYLFQEDLAI
jgi:hypothetical protein